MRKLGILLAVMLAATLGYSGTASANGHEEELCGSLPTGADADGPSPDGSGEPVSSTFDGLKKSCETSNSTDGLHPSPLLCGVADGLDARGAPGDIVRQANNGAVGTPIDMDGPLVDFDECGGPAGDDDDDDDDTQGDDDDTQVAAVQAQNAAADGSMPRTGGELFAGAGLGLMSLGALVRRFLP